MEWQIFGTASGFECSRNFSRVDAAFSYQLRSYANTWSQAWRLSCSIQTAAVKRFMLALPSQRLSVNSYSIPLAHAGQLNIFKSSIAGNGTGVRSVTALVVILFLISSPALLGTCLSSV
jgi:hypothetical protein